MLQLQAGGNAEPTWKVNHSLICEALLALALGTPPQKKNGIFWEFFPNVRPPPLLGTRFQKKSMVYFAF